MLDVIARNNVIVTGRGTQPMLFVHGFGCDQTMWRLVAPAFEADYKVVRFDYVGLGKSDLAAYSEERYGALDGYVQDVLDVCAALNLRRVILIGHSVSAIVGILAAVQQPGLFDRLILIGPSPRYIDDEGYVGGFKREDIDGLLELMDKNYLGWANALASIVMKNPDRPELANDLAEVFCSTDPRVARKFAEVTFFGDNRTDLERLHVPSLVMQCTDDSVAPEAVGQFVHKRLRGSAYHLLNATGHCPQLSHPEETIEVIREYLRT
jgi:sigma-B regulation protein RsbQ